MDVADVRAAILAEAPKGIFGMRSKFAKFAPNEDRAVTYVTAETAGWRGIYECSAQWGSKRSFMRKTPHGWVCHVLCPVWEQALLGSARGGLPRALHLGGQSVLHDVSYFHQIHLLAGNLYVNIY